MEKISHQEVQALLKQAGASIRSLNSENSELRQKIALFEREGRISKIAKQMEEKNLHDDLSFEEKLASLRDAANLDVTEEAIKLASPQGLILGSMEDHMSPGVVNAQSNLEMFIATGDAPE